MASYLTHWAHTGDPSPLGHWRRGLAAISPCLCAAWKGPTGAGFGFPLELYTPRLMSSCVAFTTRHPHPCSSQSSTPPPLKKKKHQIQTQPNQTSKKTLVPPLSSLCFSTALSTPACASLQMLWHLQIQRGLCWFGSSSSEPPSFRARYLPSPSLPEEPDVPLASEPRDSAEGVVAPV